MDNDKKFPEQNAPVKNTDNAFVQVGEDGEPVMPVTNDKSKTDELNKASETP